MTASQFSFLNRKDAINFLRIMLRELRTMTAREGFSGVRKAIDLALLELKKVDVASTTDEQVHKQSH